jgi:hypothetical protein
MSTKTAPCRIGAKLFLALCLAAASAAKDRQASSKKLRLPVYPHFAELAVLSIFPNRACFDRLRRVNSKGGMSRGAVTKTDGLR